VHETGDIVNSKYMLGKLDFLPRHLTINSGCLTVLIKANLIAFVSISIPIDKCRLWNLDDMKINPTDVVYITCDLVFTHFIFQNFCEIQK
jgi:hypothetical protein